MSGIPLSGVGDGIAGLGTGNRTVDGFPTQNMLTGGEHQVDSAQWRGGAASDYVQHIPTVSTNLRNAPALKRFGIAKERISSLFEDARSLLDDSVQRLADVSDASDDVTSLLAQTRSSLEQNRGKLANVCEKVKSNKMKVAFFGRTSNGKSSVINAMLRDRILPSGIGHTTSCFCCVEGTGETSPFLQQAGSPHRQSVQVSPADT